MTEIKYMPNPMDILDLLKRPSAKILLTVGPRTRRHISFVSVNAELYTHLLGSIQIDHLGNEHDRNVARVTVDELHRNILELRNDAEEAFKLLNLTEQVLEALWAKYASVTEAMSYFCALRSPALAKGFMEAIEWTGTNS